MITQLPLKAIEWFLTESHLYAAYIVYFLIQQWQTTWEDMQHPIELRVSSLELFLTLCFASFQHTKVLT